MKRKIFVIGLTLLFAVAFTVPVLAGGWAVVTLDELPSRVEASQPLEIGFMVRQHGVTPLSGLSPVITANLAGSTQSVRVQASDEGKVGHYVATLTLPRSGKWQWAIEAFNATQPMPSLTVMDKAPIASEPLKTAPGSLPLFASGVGLLGAIGGLLALQRKVRWATAFVVIGLLVSGVGFVSAVGQPKADATLAPHVTSSRRTFGSAGEREAQVESSSKPSISQVELGHNLFIAKGCMLCHSHNETNRIREFGVDIGPDLTNFSASPEYLRVWLRNPSAAKSTAQMPTLGLSDSEIEALIAFINDK